MRKKIIASIFICLFILIVIAWFIAAELTSPKRSTWNESDWQKYSSQLQIEHFDCDAGFSKCLLVQMNSNMPLTEKAKNLRQQLIAREIALPSLGKPKNILLMLHGKNSRKEHLLSAAIRYAALGYFIVIPDLPAHGESKRKKMAFAVNEDEADFALRVLKEVRTKLNAPEMPAQLWAMSMGSIYANRAISRDQRAFSAVVIVSGLDRLDSVVQEQVKWLPKFFFRYLRK